MTTTPKADFEEDKPLTQKQHDRLNRAPFADRISGVLRGLEKGTSLIVGIYGPWGDGKTTILNLLRADLSKNDAFVVQDFNPWRLINEDAIFRGFFSMLESAIGASLSTKLERAKAKTGKVIRPLRWITKASARLFKSAETVDDLLASLEEIAVNGDSVNIEELRSRIISLLIQSKRRIIVLIDDIDRLDDQEIYMLFRLIKACADFPNVCYVLAFDETAVAMSLGERYGRGGQSSGRAFLEKIIQVPLKLPVAAKEDLRDLCFEYVDRMLAAAGTELSKEQIGEFVEGFDSCISVRLTTPRAAKRYGNGLMFALPMLTGEVNVVDLLLIEAIRAFYPEFYDIVRDNHSDFSGVENDSYGPRKDNPRSQQLLAPLYSGMQEHHADGVKRLLSELFPRLSHRSYGSDFLKRWSQEQRICSPKYCSRYFTYSVPRNDVSDSDIATLVKNASSGDIDRVKSCLSTYLDSSKARRVIERLRNIEKSIDANAAEILAISLAELGNSVPNPVALFSFEEPPSQAAILISHLLRNISNEDDRLIAAKRVISVVDPLWFGVECVRWLYVSDKPEKQDSNTLTDRGIVDVRQVLVERIKSSALKGALLFDPDLPQEDSQLYEWWRAEGRDPVQTHLVNIFAKDPKQIIRFLQSQTPLAWSSATPHVSDLGADQLKNIRLIIDLDVLSEWIRKHCPGDFEKPRWRDDNTIPIEQRLPEQFMFVYNKWKKEGEPSIVSRMEDDSNHLEKDSEVNEEEKVVV